MIAIDVNVVAYLLIDGSHTEQSEAVLIRDPVWAAPLLWRSERRDVLAGYLRRGELDRTGVLDRIGAADALVQGREYVVDDARVVDLVAASTRSAYDCEYVALAEALDIPLVTNDRLLRTAFPDRALSPPDFLATG